MEKMKLSEAIRKGAEKRPKAMGELFALKEGQICSCALGAAFETVVGNIEVDNEGYPLSWQNSMKGWEKVFEAYPELRERIEPPIDLKNRTGEEHMSDIVWMLNDKHDWTREQIADWLESLGH